MAVLTCSKYGGIAHCLQVCYIVYVQYCLQQLYRFYFAYTSYDDTALIHKGKVANIRLMRKAEKPYIMQE